MILWAVEGKSSVPALAEFFNTGYAFSTSACWKGIQ